MQDDQGGRNVGGQSAGLVSSDRSEERAAHDRIGFGVRSEEPSLDRRSFGDLHAGRLAEEDERSH
jgi:hypothetical protein